MSDKIALICLAMFALSAIYFAAAKLVQSGNGADVRVVFFIFSLALIYTPIFVFGVKAIGGIDDAGVFHGSLGSTLNNLIDFMLDLRTDALVYGALFLIVVGPQLLSYCLSGIFGCAHAPILIPQSIIVLTWSIVKSTALAAGVMVGLAIASLLFKNSLAWTLQGTATIIIFGGMLIAMSMFLLFAYRDLWSLVSNRLLSKILIKFTRNISKEPTSIPLFHISNFAYLVNKWPQFLFNSSPAKPESPPATAATVASPSPGGRAPSPAPSGAAT